MKVHHDIQIDTSPELYVDIYVPDGEPPKGGFPVAQYQHGGAWTLGNKSRSKNPCDILAKEGIVCVASSYRLSGASTRQLESIFIFITVIMFAFSMTITKLETMYLMFSVMVLILAVYLSVWVCIPRDSAQHPQHVLDVSRAFKWTCDNVAQYGGNDKKIYVMGHSAGGHLSSLMTTNHHYLRHVGGDPERIAGCISVSGVYSDKRMAETGIGRELLHNVFGKRDNYYDSFPVYSVDDKTPPFMLINAGKDIGLKRHTLDFRCALRGKNRYCQVEYYDKETHMSITRKWGRGERNEEILNAVLKFMGECEEMYRK